MTVCPALRSVLERVTWEANKPVKHMKILTIILTLCLISCERVTSGKVVEKHYSPARQETRFHYVHVDENTTIPIPYSVTIPERYEIVVEGGSDGKKRGCITIPATTYENTRVGDIYGAEAQ